MNYKKISQNYFNSGGGCMVHIREIYDLDNKRTLYMMSNESGSSLVSGDYIRQEIDFDDIELLGTFEPGVTHCDNKYFPLFMDCWLEYIKADCKYSKSRARVPLDMMPADMLSAVTMHYLNWLSTEKDGCIETDGEQVFVDDEYKSPAELLEPDAIAANKMLIYMHEQMATTDLPNETPMQQIACEDAWEKFYGLPVVVGFGELMITFENSAAVFSGLQEMLEYIIAQQ